MEFFMKEVIDEEWGNYFDLTPAGYMMLVAIMIVLLLGACLVSGWKAGSKKRIFSARQLAFCAMAMALAFVTSLIKIIDMPMGGAVTLFSMMFICLTGYWYGLRVGLLTAVAYGFLQLISNPYIISIPQMLTDYILAFGALGLSGLFAGKKHGLVMGYLVGVTGRFVFTFLSGMIFFGSYASAYHMAAPLYSFCYNGAYLGLEALISVLILSLPPVRQGLARVKEMAAGKM